MAFFDDSFMKKDKDEEDDLLNLDDNTNNTNNNTQINNNNQEELEINRKNREHYENLMNDSKSKLDMYFDKNNILLKIFTFLLFIFIICGVAYYVLQYLATK